MFEFKNPLFIKSAVDIKDYPRLVDLKGKVLPEVALAGRSNVGKSSLINHLLGKKDLAKVSSTPGKTQLINFFTINQQLGLVDLPGYGYANVPPHVKQQWGPMVEGYLEHRASLKLILFLLDIRRMPNQDDLQLLEWIVYHQRSMILVLTKVDKVNKSELVANTQAILSALPYNNIQYAYYSVKDNTKKVQLTAMIQDALKNEMEIADLE